MKIFKRIVSFVLMITLVFTAMISSAYSYQEAKTLTSENVFSIGEANAYLSINNLSESKELYPCELIPMKPEVVNNGNSSFWAILALKVPALSEPFSDFNMLYYNTEGKFLYPAFYPYSSPSESEDDTISSLIYVNSVLSIPLLEDMTGEYATPSFYEFSHAGSILINYENWELLDFCTDYAEPGKGEFFIYYFGLKTPLSPNQKAPDIWSGLAAANFQKSAYDVWYTGELVHKELPSFDYNFGIEMRLFTVQSDYNEAISSGNITEAWDYCQKVHSKFGKQSIISADFKSEYTAGEHTLPIYVTSDVKKIQVTNETTGAQQTIDIASKLNPIDNYISVANVPISILRSGDYYISAIDNDNNALNRTYLGYINVL